MTRAYATAKTQAGTLVVANLQYSGIVFAAFYSVVLFNDRIDAAGWTGMDTVWVTGKLQTLRNDSMMGVSGYHVNASSVTKYTGGAK